MLFCWEPCLFPRYSSLFIYIYNTCWFSLGFYGGVERRYEAIYKSYLFWRISYLFGQIRFLMKNNLFVLMNKVFVRKNYYFFSDELLFVQMNKLFLWTKKLFARTNEDLFGWMRIWYLVWWISYLLGRMRICSDELPVSYLFVRIWYLFDIS